MNEKITILNETTCFEGKRADFLKSLQELSVRALYDMFQPEKSLFCYRVKRRKEGIEREGLSVRYTIISLLGLHQIEKYGRDSPINTQGVLCGLISRAMEIDSIGDLGLLLWLCALSSPQSLEEIYRRIDIQGSLSRYPDAVQMKTTELAWFLTGLSYMTLTGSPSFKGQKDLVAQTYKLIKDNYGHRGVFRHQGKNTIKGLLRGRMGCFADQVYPIYAFSKFAVAFNNKEALEIALECGYAICKLQGPLGQWWWHYDSVTGKVLGRYPVYSVHQHGMAPMALFALSDATGKNFDAPIYKGLEWVVGENELGFNLVDTIENVIWRSFYRKNYKMRLEEILSLSQLKKNARGSDDLIILFESRPYCMGWFLYAFESRIGSK